MTEGGRKKLETKADLARAFNALDLALESQRMESEARQLATDLLPLLDGIERLCRGLHDQPPEAIVARAEGLGLLAEVADDVVVRLDLARTGRTGERVDPRRHEVVETRLEAGRDRGTVLEVLEPGWVFRGQVLRPAKVVASLASESAE